jgi:O-Antigen ligase
MIRFALLMLVISAISVYAWRDWYKALCALILLIAVIQHPDFPNSMGGIQGANPWNIALLSIVLAWASSRSREGLTWDMPGHVTAMLLLYLAVVLVGWVRMMLDRTVFLDHLSTGYLVSEHLINAVKWVVPGLLLFDGCRDRRRLLLAVGALLGIYVGLAVQVIKWMPPSAALEGDSLQLRSLKILVKEVGFHRVNLSMMLAGASWAIAACAVLVTRPVHRLLLLGVGLGVVYGQALTAGRAGYVTWALIGLCLCLIRWRKYLLLGPIVALVITSAIPGVIERLSHGLEDQQVDEYALTAGRNIAWPLVIDKIEESPVIGFGRQAMLRTGLTWELESEYGEGFGHPHSAYLEALLDNGVVGFALIILFHLVVLSQAISLFRDSRNPLFVAIGGVTCSLVLALLFASMGSQTFYPREGAVGMWCAIGLMLRVSVARARAVSGAGEPGSVGQPAPALARTGVEKVGTAPEPAGRDWWRRESPPARPESADSLIWAQTS